MTVQAEEVEANLPGWFGGMWRHVFNVSELARWKRAATTRRDADLVGEAGLARGVVVFGLGEDETVVVARIGGAARGKPDA
jgi:hypothetical protein